MADFWAIQAEFLVPLLQIQQSFFWHTHTEMAQHSDSEQEEYSDQYNESEPEYSDNDPMSEEDEEEESDEVLVLYIH